MINDLVALIQTDYPSSHICCEMYNNLICVNIIHPDNQSSEGRIYTYRPNDMRGYNFERIDPHTYTKVTTDNKIIGIKSDGSQEIFSYTE